MMAVHTIRTYAITAVVMLVFGLFSAASWRTELQQRDQDAAAVVMERNTARIAANTARLEGVVASQCAQARRAAQASNAILDALIVSVSETRSIGAEEIRVRVKRYADARVDIVACPPAP